MKFIAIVERSGWGCETAGGDGAWSGSRGRGFDRVELAAGTLGAESEELMASESMGMLKASFGEVLKSVPWLKLRLGLIWRQFVLMRSSKHTLTVVLDDSFDGHEMSCGEDWKSLRLLGIS